MYYVVLYNILNNQLTIVNILLKCKNEDLKQQELMFK